MKLYLCANEYTEEQRNEAALVRDTLSARGFVFAGDASECDLVISLGGDGAMLKAAKTALAADKPLMGINSGRLGYLCAMKVQDMYRFEEVLSKARISGRLVLETEAGGKKVYAVNDLIFGKQFFGQTVEIEVSSGSKKLMDLIGDGLIVATPTGSTAYSRHAGGPVIMEGVDAVCLTPICADAKALVAGASGDIEVFLKRGDCDVYVDGEKLAYEGKKLRIRRSEKILKLLMPGE